MMNLGLLSGNKNMKSVIVSFRLPYYTHWGQNLLVCGSEPVLGSWDVKKGLSLSPVHQGDELIWCGSVTVPSGFRCEYSYYVVDDKKNVVRWEVGEKRKLLLPDGVQDGEVVQLRDIWQIGSDTFPFRSAFKNVIFQSSKNLAIERPLGVIQNKLDLEDSVVVHFKICCPNIQEDTSVYVIGSSTKLGQWKVQDGVKLSYAGESIWHADCLTRKDEFPIKYKYCKYGTSGNFSLENGPNRDLHLDFSNNQRNYIFLSDGMMREMAWRGAGVSIPMFSVRSEADLGVGEFFDLKLLVDWAVASGFHLVQLLPINDTSVHGMWWDSYPYSSLSVFALHPLYLRVLALSENIPEEIKQEISEAKERLDGKDVDYDGTMSTKLSIAKKIFALERDTILKSGSFQTFFSQNEDWLKPYAAFCFLRDFFETSDHSQWGRFSLFSKDKLEKLVSKESIHYDIICFHYYIQFHLHVQLSEAADYARRKGVVLKGDLPIGVDRNSVDTWVYPNLFRMNTSTGAPPDYFDKNGQNWGFPTYNWEEMSKDNYAWWRARLTQMAKYFTAYRIDHILGFFRIWELPEHAMTGLLGKFRPSIPLSQEELEREGIWDFDRLSHPYIRKEFLQDKCGASWTFIASNFLNEYQKNCYEFMEDCNTEKKIASKLKSFAERSLLLESEDKIRSDLFDLLKNIVLVRDPENARNFYPRFNLEDTSSFQDLDDHSKNVLKRLYYDYYFHRQENLWRQNALETLPVLLNSSDMLACGEDLGLIPSCVHPVMQELGLVGLRIQRMPSEPDLEFGIPSQYSYMTVCAPSCHDCSTLRAWWEEDEERRRRFFKTVVGSDALPPSECIPEIAYFILRQHVEAPSMWAIFPLQDLLALKKEYTTRPATEETINDPTNPKHYWRYRAHVTLESLLKDKEHITTIKELISGSGRSCPPQEAAAKIASASRVSYMPHQGEIHMPRKGTNFRRTNKKDGDWEVVKPTSSSKKGRKTFNFFENRSTHHTGASSKEKLPELSYSPPSPKTEKPSPPCTLSGYVKVENQTSTAKKGRKTYVCLEDKSTHEAFSNEKIVSDGEFSDDDVIDHSVCCADVGDLTDDDEEEPMHDHSKCCGVDRFWDRTSFSPHIPYIPSVTDVIVPPPRPMVEEPSSPPPHPDSMMKLLAEEYLTDEQLSKLPPGVAEIMKEVREKIKAELDLKEKEKNDG